MAERSSTALRQAAQTDVQGAVNLSGVVRSLDEIVSDVLWSVAGAL